MSRSPFPSLRTAGGLLPADLFNRVLESGSGENALAGREPEAYGLLPHENVREVAARAFDYLNGAWQAFEKERARAAQEGRSPRTRDRWLLPLFRTLDFGQLPSSGGFTVEDHSYPVSNRWEHVPIHLIAWGVDLDRRTPGVTGAARQAPQSMLQELLNRSDDHLWAILSNGSTLRLLRDSRSLAGSAYVEFDLELIFSEQLFADFVLLFRLVHASRFAVPADKTPADCWLERWRTDAVQVGERALARLRKGVEQAINTLGSGFLRHPDNDQLRRQLEGRTPPGPPGLGRLGKEDYNRAILRLVYRLLFWFVAEDRDVLLIPLPEAPEGQITGPDLVARRKRILAARERYTTYFSAQRLRGRAIRSGTDHHDDLWEATQIVLGALGEDEGRPELAIPGLGGLFDRIKEKPDGTPLDRSKPDELDAPLEGMRIANGDLLQAIRHLAVVTSDVQRRPVNFRELGPEELGSVYEWLLEFHVDLDVATRTFTLRQVKGSDRKTTGSYYTPTSLTEALLDTALDPVLDEAARSAETVEAKVEALLNVTVCDPACGSGHFLVAAAHRIARRVAQIRSDEEEPAPALVRHAMREVVSRCIHGVDLNEMAVDLAKVALWIESIEPGRPLALLDTNIRVGNALLGATPALIKRGIPKEAFKAIEGDDKKVAAAVAKENETEKDRASKGLFQDSLFGNRELDQSNIALGARTRELITQLPTKLTDLAVQRRRLRAIDADRLTAKRVADAWCGAFVQELTAETRLSAITQSTLGWIGGDDFDEEQSRIAERVGELARDYRFFHWHVEFPHLFRVPQDGAVDRQTGWDGGFTCVIGNPPWERVKIQEKEFFASRDEDIANAKNAAARKKAIAALATSDEEADRNLHAEFTGELRKADGSTLLLRDSGRYPLTGRGDINTYAVFAETGRTVLAPHGRVGMVLPTGIATDATTQFFFKDMVETKTLASLYDFENEEKLFPHVTNRVNFCIWTAAGSKVPQTQIMLASRLRRTSQIAERRFVLTPEDITLLNPNTGTCPVFDNKRNAEITVAIYNRIPILWRESTSSGEDINPWDLSFLRMLDMANDSGLFRPSATNNETLEHMLEDGWGLDGNILVRESERLLPLYEAKMLHHFDHRFATYLNATKAQLNKGTLPRSTPESKNNPDYFAMPEYWVPESTVASRLSARAWNRRWFLGWRDMCRRTDTRTMIFSVAPIAAVGDKFLLALPQRDGVLLQANMSSHMLDFCARQKISGTSLKYFIVKQLPVLPPSTYQKECPWDGDERLDSWVRVRALELTYTSYDMEAFARDHFDDGPPYRWDEERRFWLRAELDAAYFHLYGVTRDDVDYIMDTFRAFRNVTPDLFARTKKAILEIYDAMNDRVPYRTPLDPPPGQGPRHLPRPSA